MYKNAVLAFICHQWVVSFNNKKKIPKRSSLCFSPNKVWDGLIQIQGEFLQPSSHNAISHNEDRLNRLANAVNSWSLMYLKNSIRRYIKSERAGQRSWRIWPQSLIWPRPHYWAASATYISPLLSVTFSSKDNPHTRKGPSPARVYITATCRFLSSNTEGFHFKSTASDA